MATYSFRGFSVSQAAYMQGALQAEVIGPLGREADARELAELVADGHSRKAAAEMISRGGGNPKGLRVMSAARVR